MKKKETEKSKKASAVSDKQVYKLNEKLELLQKERDETFAQLQRLSADYANFQKRSVKQTSDAISYEKERVIKVILPGLDNFEHVLAHAHKAENVEDVVKGVQIVYDGLLDILKSLDVEQIHALDEIFDPAVHQAMMQRAEPEKKEGIVLEEFQKGYSLNGRVIRPSKVIVNKLPAEEAPAEDSQEEKTE